MSFNVLNVVQLGGQRVGDINDDDFPVSLAFIEKSHDAEDFDLLNLADIADLFTDLADIERIVVSLCLGFGMKLRRVFPGLRWR